MCLSGSAWADGHFESFIKQLRSQSEKVRVDGAHDLLEYVNGLYDSRKGVEEKDFESLLPYLKSSDGEVRDFVGLSLALLVPEPPLWNTWNPSLRAKLAEGLARDTVFRYQNKTPDIPSILNAIRKYSKDYKNQNEVIRYFRMEALGEDPQFPEKLRMTLKPLVLDLLTDEKYKNEITILQSVVKMAKYFDNDAEIAFALIDILNRKDNRTNELRELKRFAGHSISEIGIENTHVLNQLAKIPITQALNKRQKVHILIQQPRSIISPAMVNAVIDGLNEFGMYDGELEDLEKIVQFLKAAPKLTRSQTGKMMKLLHKGVFYEAMRREWPDFLITQDLAVDPRLVLSPEKIRHNLNWIEANPLRLKAFLNDLKGVNSDPDNHEAPFYMDQAARVEVAKQIEPLIVRLLQNHDSMEPIENWQVIAVHLVQLYSIESVEIQKALVKICKVSDPIHPSYHSVANSIMAIEILNRMENLNPEAIALLREYWKTPEGLRIIQSNGIRIHRMLMKTLPAEQAEHDCGLGAEVRKNFQLRLVPKDRKD